MNIARMLILVLALAGTSVAQDAAKMRAYFPNVYDDEIQAALDGEVLFYNDQTMPPMFQEQVDVNGSFGGGPSAGLRSIFQPIAANIDPIFSRELGRLGNGNIEFPWGTPAGLHRTKGVHEIRFVSLPKAPNGVKWPIVVWSANIQPDQLPTHQWTFPVGTIVGELLTMTNPDTNLEYAFELRVRKREIDGWDIDVFRPFSGPEEVSAKIKKLYPDWQNDTTLANAVAVLDRPQRTGTMQSLRLMTDPRALPLRKLFDETAGADPLPELPNEVVAKLLTSDGEPWWSVVGGAWREDSRGLMARAPMNETQPFHLVPQHYDGAFVPVDRQSCTRCHETASQHVEAFAKNPTTREWYGRIRGGDGIFSFHPFEARNQTVGTGGFRQDSTPFALNAGLVQAGYVADFDQSIHPESMYAVAPAFDIRRTAPRDHGVTTGGKKNVTD